MKLPKHLYKHPHGCFYFVLAVPTALQAHFQGFPRIRYSLGTKDPTEAKMSAYKHTAHWLYEFEKLTTTMTKKTPEELLAENISTLVVATRSGFISQAKTREEREMDIEEIGRLKAEGVKPADLMQVQKPTVKVVQAEDKFTPKDKITLQEAYKLFLVEIASIDNKKTKSIKDKAVFDLKQFLGAKTLLYTVGKKELQEFKHHLLNEVGNSYNTVHFKFNYIIQFFELMKVGGFYLLENPAKGQVKYSKAHKNKVIEKTKHLPFSEDDLQKIFSCKNYSTINKPHLFWCPLIALFTGMRASEIGQLKITDISKKHKHINIATSNSDQSLKTIYSNRTLPIHPILIEIGLFEYVEDIAKFQQWKLFPNLKKTINGYGTRISNDFSRYLEQIGVKEDRKSFHSFRSTLNQLLSKNDVEWKTQHRFLGHEIEGINYKHYDQEVPFSKLKACLSVINFEIEDCVKYKQGMFNAYIEKILREND